MALASIGHELPDLTKKLCLSSDLLVLERAWEQEIGRMKEFAQIAALDNGALVIEVSSSGDAGNFAPPQGAHPKAQ